MVQRFSWSTALVPAAMLVLSTLVSTAEAGLGQWTLVGPPGGIGRSIAVDPTNGDVVYAVVDRSVFKSTDGAAHWALASTGLPTDSVGTVTIDPTTTTRLFASAGADGVYVSTDSAATWNPANTGLPAHTGDNYAYDLAIDPTTTGTVYVGYGKGGVFKSTNGGASWSPSSSGLGSARVYAVALDPVTPTTLYASSFDAAVALYKSIDGGANWSPTSLTANAFGNSDVDVFDIVVAPDATATIYVLTYKASSQDYGPYIAKSSDGGATFTRVGPGGVVRSFAVDPTNPARLLGGTSDGVFTSLDSGLTWTRTSVGLAAIYQRTILALAIAPSNAARTYAAPGNGSAGGNGIYKTDDDAGHWTSASTGLPRSNAASGITLAPDDPTRLSVLSGGLLASDDAGGHWTPQNVGLDGLGGARLVTIDPVDPDVQYAADAVSVFKSTDRGTTWARASTGLGSVGVVGAEVVVIVIDPITPTTLYAATTAGVFRSTNAAASWTAASAGLSSLIVQSLAIVPTAPMTLYAGTPDGAFKSTDGAATWMPTPITLSSGPNVIARRVGPIVVDPSTPGTVYASVNKLEFIPPVSLTGFSELRKSTDGGASWTTLPIGGPTALAIDPTAPTTLYVGTGGIQRSLDGGASWAAFGSGLASTDVRAIAVDPDRPSWIYAATAHGLDRIEGPCATNVDCTDGNPCTTDVCNVGDGSCANTVVPDGTACDDADACSAASACDGGRCAALGSLPTCDDGIECTDDVCSPLTGTCVTALRDSHGLCDDGSTCTHDDVCGGGSCAGTAVACAGCYQCENGLGCIAEPRTGCAAPSAKGSSLSLHEAPDATDPLTWRPGDRLTWKWKSAGTTSKADFGDPLAGTTYSLCLYDTAGGSARLLQVPSPDSLCGSSGCNWKSKRTGYAFKNNPLRNLSLSASSSGKGTITVVGKGIDFSPAGPPALPMTISPKVVMQLQRNDTAACWGVEFASSRVNTATRFEAKLP